MRLIIFYAALYITAWGYAKPGVKDFETAVHEFANAVYLIGTMPEIATKVHDVLGAMTSVNCFTMKILFPPAGRCPPPVIDSEPQCQECDVDQETSKETSQLPTLLQEISSKLTLQSSHKGPGPIDLQQAMQEMNCILMNDSTVRDSFLDALCKVVTMASQPVIAYLNKCLSNPCPIPGTGEPVSPNNQLSKHELLEAFHEFSALFHNVTKTYLQF